MDRAATLLTNTINSTRANLAQGSDANPPRGYLRLVEQIYEPRTMQFLGHARTYVIEYVHEYVYEYVPIPQTDHNHDHFEH